MQRIEDAAARAAAATTKALTTNSIPHLKKAALLQIDVEKTVRKVAEKKQEVVQRAQERVEGALERQTRQVERANGRVDHAEARLDRAQDRFDDFLARSAYVLEGSQPTAPAAAPASNGRSLKDFSLSWKKPNATALPAVNHTLPSHTLPSFWKRGSSSSSHNATTVAKTAAMTTTTAATPARAFPSLLLWKKSAVPAPANRTFLPTFFKLESSKAKVNATTAPATTTTTTTADTTNTDTDSNTTLPASWNLEAGSIPGGGADAMIGPQRPIKVVAVKLVPGPPSGHPKDEALKTLADAASVALVKNTGQIVGAESSIAKTLADAASVMMVRNTGHIVGTEASIAKTLTDAASVALVRNSGAMVGAEAGAIRAMADAASVALVRGSGALSAAAADAIAQAPQVLAQVPGHVAGQVAGVIAQVPGQMVSGVVGALVSQIPVVGTINQAFGTFNNALGVANNALYVANTGLKIAGTVGDGAAFLIGRGIEAHKAYILANGRPELVSLTSMPQATRLAVLEALSADAIAGGDDYASRVGQYRQQQGYGGR